MRATLKMPEGLKQMMDELAKLEASELDAVAVEMLDAGAEVALDGMQRRVPVKTGKLKGHLKKGPVQQDGNRSVVEIGILDAPGEVVRYGTAQEYGTSSVPAQSYMRETMKLDRAKIYAAMRKVLKARIGAK
ncbi:MAG: HK97 gp10 family phage protein [Anaerolineaceae bacterium]|nr:HK97 gp10 family phage protein [Anaerolineaceae bacterium]